MQNKKKNRIVLFSKLEQKSKKARKKKKKKAKKQKKGKLTRGAQE